MRNLSVSKKFANAFEGQTESLAASLALRFSSNATFSTKNSSANGYAAAYRCFSYQSVTAAAHVRLHDNILKLQKLIIFRQSVAFSHEKAFYSYKKINSYADKLMGYCISSTTR